MSVKKVTWVVVGIMLIILIALPKLKSNKKKGIIHQDKGATQPPLSITVSPVQSSILENNIKTSGTILANDEAELSTSTSGPVTGVYFLEGSKVSKGQLLVKVNDEELQAQLRQATAKRKLVEQNEKRQKVLLNKGGISQAEYDMIDNELQALDGEVSLLKAKIDKTEIRAPFSGIIGLKNVSVGNNVSPGQVIVSLQDVSKLKIEFNIPEKYAPHVKLGNEIRFKIEGIEKYSQGKIYALDPKIDPSTRTLKVRALATTISGNVFPGSFAQVELMMDKLTTAIMVPTESIIPEMKGQKVFLYKSGIVEARPIKLGVRKEKEVQVIEGISIGDSIITSGMMQLKAGATVKIKSNKPTLNL